MKRFLKFAGLLSIVAVAARLSFAACTNTDFYCYESGPTGNLSTMNRVDSSGNEILFGNLQQGIQGTSLTSAVTSGNSLGHKVSVLLAGANNAVEGSVIIASTTVNSSVTGSVVTVTASASVIGVSAGSTNSGSVDSMYDSGFVLALATGAVVVGDILVTSATVTGAGYLATNNSPSAGTEVAVALTAESVGTNGLIRVKLIH